MNFLACKNKTIFFLILLLFSFNVQAGILLDSSFAGSSPSLNTPWTATDSIDPNLNYSGWDVTSQGDIYSRAIPWPQSWQSAQGTGDNAFVFQLCNNTQVVNGQAVPTSLADAISHNQYIYFRISPKSGSLNLNDKKIIFTIQRLNDNTIAAPRKYSVFTSVGGFQVGAELFTGSISTYDFSANTLSFIVPETGYDNITGTIEFRIYAYETTYCWHPTSLTDFIIQDPATLYSLSLTSTSGGTVTANPYSQNMRFEEYTVVQLEATPNPGYHFAGWSGDVSGKGNLRSVTMTSDKSVTANFTANVDGKMQVGMNLSWISDWATNEAFVDAFKMFRTWATKDTAWASEWACWDSGKKPPTDANGWPTQVPFVAGATTCGDGGVVSSAPGDSTHYVHTILVEPLAGGDYTVFVTGTGKIRFKDAVNTGILVLSGGTTEFTLSVPPNNNMSLQLLIYESQSNDPVRNIKIIRPGYMSTYEMQPFQTLYLGRLEPFGALRFVHWGQTNGSPIATWDERATETTYTQTGAGGVALEYMVKLANTQQKDLWINIPHKADDDYVRQTARLLRDTVGSNQKIYVEYSNETWNNDRFYPQSDYVQGEGMKLWPELSGTPWVAGDKYTALRSIQIWQIFQEEFGLDTRVQRVLATQVGNISVTRNRVDALNDPAINSGYLMPDVLAIAPYFGRGYSPSDISAAGYPTIDEMLNEGGTATASIAEQQSYVRAHKTIADTQGLELVCYEAGQGFVGVGGAENDADLTNILIAANRDNRMYDRYADYLVMLDAEGVGTCPFFDDIEKPNRYGSWGALEYLEQPVSEAPKYRALVDFITEPADLSVTITATPDPVLTDNPLTYAITVSNAGPSDATNVVVTHTLPAGVTGSGVPSQGSCTGTSVISCNLGTVNSGQSPTITVTANPNAEVLFDPIADTSIVTANVSATTTISATETDPVSTNNTATTATNVVLACLGQPVTKRGTSGNNGTSSNRFAGTSSADVIHTLSGNDWVRGNGGNDKICGGAGNDNLQGNGGADTLSGGTGTDTCNGNAGTDSQDGSCETVNNIP